MSEVQKLMADRQPGDMPSPQDFHIAFDADRRTERKRLFDARYKKYAAWPVVLWCRLRKHAGQPRWGQMKRCLRCGDAQ